jgi:hypothetical protein
MTKNKKVTSGDYLLFVDETYSGSSIEELCLGRFVSKEGMKATAEQYYRDNVDGSDDFESEEIRLYYYDIVNDEWFTGLITRGEVKVIFS